MTTVNVKDVGFCADFSQQGEWAFKYARSVAESLGLGLRIFYVPDLAWQAGELPRLNSDEAVAMDRQVREYYDTRLGDMEDVGFRICEGFTDWELRRCLMGGLYQVLVLPYHSVGAPFAGKTIEDFAYGFNGPIVLVGPEKPNQFLLNPGATLLTSRLLLDGAEWAELKREEPVAVSA